MFYAFLRGELKDVPEPKLIDEPLLKAADDGHHWALAKCIKSEWEIWKSFFI